jgi:hypothetical protein
MVTRFVFGFAFAIVLAGASYPALAVSQPPRAGCLAVARQEYDAAKKKGLLRTRNGEYVRTGSVFRRAYWYCH